VVSDLAKSLKFYTGLFGMQEIDFKDGTLVFLTTPERDDLLVLNPGGDWGSIVFGTKIVAGEFVR
jgi:catechol 2,3-dioxygenase-like lactoylglutathione lyase family enzyme